MPLMVFLFVRAHGLLSLLLLLQLWAYAFSLEKHGLSVPREIGGHGVGHYVHEEPFVPNYGKYGEGVILKKGMVLAIEPMLSAGKKEVITLSDNWTICTKDGSDSAHSEHTVAITDDGYEILTGE